MASLPARQQTVITWRYGLEDGHERSHEAIADVLGVSRQVVARQEQTALLTLRKLAGGENIKADLKPA